LFIFDLVGITFYKILRLLSNWSPFRISAARHLVLKTTERICLIFFLSSIISLFSIYHFWMHFLFFWIVPLISVFGAFVRLRSIAEHLVCESEHELNKTRHVQPTCLESLTIAPLNVNCHIAHHLFPSVPFYNLLKLHLKLMEDPVYRK